MKKTISVLFVTCMMISFLIENDNLLEKLNIIWDKDSADFKKYWQQACPQKNILKTKKKSDGNETYIFVIKKYLM